MYFSNNEDNEYNLDNIKYEYDIYMSENNIKSIKDKLNEYGLVIIPNILNKLEIEKMKSGTWDFFEHITSNWDEAIDRNNFKTWENLLDLKPNNSMMYQKWNIGHSQHLWDIRSNPKIVDIFSNIWNVKPEDLLVSFDGMSFLPPPEITNFGWSDNDFWFHLDQSITKPDFEGVQSWVTGYDVNDGDASLVFYEKSHKLIDEFVDNFGVRIKSDWFLLDEDEEEFFKLKCERKAVKCPEGSLVIWDSRLVHCAINPRQNREKENFRCVAYLSYAPKNKCNEEIIKQKIIGFENMKTSNHYANRPTFFQSIPYELQEYDISELIKPINKPILSNLGKSLVGFIDNIDNFISEI